MYLSTLTSLQTCNKVKSTIFIVFLGITCCVNHHRYLILQNAKWAEGAFDNILIRPTFRPFRRRILGRVKRTFVIRQPNYKHGKRNKGEFRSRPISPFVYIFALSQSECVKRVIT